MALLDRLGGRRAAPRSEVDVEALVAACIEHPDDDGRREVLADALLERGDPRGEFITLQLRDARQPLTEPERKRMASLQRRHEKAWLVDLARVTKLRVFRRGRGRAAAGRPRATRARRSTARS